MNLCLILTAPICVWPVRGQIRSGHFITDSPSVCPSWSRAPNYDWWPYFSLEV